MINFFSNITFYEVALRAFSMALWPDLWLAVVLPPHQEDSRESGHEVIEMSLGASAKSGPKGLFYGLVFQPNNIRRKYSAVGNLLQISV
jgi:hypothetical protein